MSSSSLCVLFSSTIFTLMIGCTWSRVCRSVISWNGGIFTYLAFTRVTVILLWAVSAACTYCIALRRSSNSFSLSRNNPGVLTGCWYFWICTQGIRFVFTFPNYLHMNFAGSFSKLDWELFLLVTACFVIRVTWNLALASLWPIALLQ